MYAGHLLATFSLPFNQTPLKINVLKRNTHATTIPDSINFTPQFQSVLQYCVFKWFLKVSRKAEGVHETAARARSRMWTLQKNVLRITKAGSVTLEDKRNSCSSVVRWASSRYLSCACTGLLLLSCFSLERHNTKRGFCKMNRREVKRPRKRLSVYISRRTLAFLLPFLCYIVGGCCVKCHI